MPTPGPLTGPNSVAGRLHRSLGVMWGEPPWSGLFHFSASFVPLPLVETTAQQQMFTQGPCSAVFAVQTHTICCQQNPGGQGCTINLTRETKWEEERKDKGQTADAWVGDFPVLGSWMSDGGGEVCCASCKLALEGLVRFLNSRTKTQL